MSFQKVLVFNSSLLAHPCKRVAGELVAPLVLKVPIVTTQARIQSSRRVGSHQGRPAQYSCRRKSSEGYADNGTCRRGQRPTSSGIFRGFADHVFVMLNAFRHQISLQRMFRVAMRSDPECSTLFGIRYLFGHGVIPLSACL